MKPTSKSPRSNFTSDTWHKRKWWKNPNSSHLGQMYLGSVQRAFNLVNMLFVDQEVSAFNVVAFNLCNFQVAVSQSWRRLQMRARDIMRTLQTPWNKSMRRLRISIAHGSESAGPDASNRVALVVHVFRKRTAMKMNLIPSRNSDGPANLINL